MPYRPAVLSHMVDVGIGTAVPAGSGAGQVGLGSHSARPLISTRTRAWSATLASAAATRAFRCQVRTARAASSRRNDRARWRPAQRRRCRRRHRRRYRRRRPWTTRSAARKRRRRATTSDLQDDIAERSDPDRDAMRRATFLMARSMPAKLNDRGVSGRACRPLVGAVVLLDVVVVGAVARRHARPGRRVRVTIHTKQPGGGWMDEQPGAGSCVLYSVI